MSRAAYKARMPWGDMFEIEADLVDATAPIVIIAEGERAPTGYQTADARHRPLDAIMLAVRSCGREWFAEPNDTRSTDEILSELKLEIEQ